MIDVKQATVEAAGHEGWLRRVEFWGVLRNEVMQ